MNKPKIFIFAALLLASTGVTSGVEAQQPPAQPAAPQLPQAPNMTFFVISAGPGKGADLGGLEGADQLCLQLAQRHGAGGKTWRAYLSTQAADGKPAVNARDRIGNGPWQNFKGETVAKTVDDLHSDSNTLGMNTSLTERGQIIQGVGFAPTVDDVLTGSTPEGRAFPAGEDRTCRNWTSGTQGAAMLGHIDRKGLRDDVPSRSWNSASLARTRRRLQPGRSAQHRRRRAVRLLRRPVGGPAGFAKGGRACNAVSYHRRVVCGKWPGDECAGAVRRARVGAVPMPSRLGGH